MADKFPKVKEAREALRARAEEIIELYMQNAKDAHGSGDFETCSKSLQWLIEHMPSDDTGIKLVDISVDKPAQIESGPKGPIIQIGIALGGVNTEPKALPSSIIDITPSNE